VSAPQGMSRVFFVSRLRAPLCVGKYRYTIVRFIVGVISRFIGIIAFTGWALFLWIHVRHFGPENQCNDKVKYVIMFVDVEATKPWLRGVWIAILAVSAVLLSFRAGVHSLLRYFQREIEREEREREDNEDQAGERVSVTEWELTREGGGEGRDKWYVNVTILQLLCVISLSQGPNTYQLPLRCTIYAIVTLELMVSILV
jgi:hypothetical protein